MAKNQQFDELKYEDNKQTISELIKADVLPVVVRVVDDGKGVPDYNVFSSKLPEDVDILLTQKMKVKYAHVKVLNYTDSSKREKEMGPEFVLEHDTYVDVEFLLPAKYGSEMKFIHRPGSWKHYVTVSQLIEQLPRYVNVREDTVASPTKGLGKNLLIPKDTKLELVRLFKQPSSSRTCIELSDGRYSYSLSESDRISFTEVDDRTVYHLYKLVRYKMLPKVFQFCKDITLDVIILDNQLNTAAMAAVDGPMELCGFVDVEVVVGWVRNKSEQTYTTVLIPSGLWDLALVQQRYHLYADDKVKYIKRKYGPCQSASIQFVEKALYLTTLNLKDVTWLRSTDFYTRSLSGNAMFEPVKTEFGASSDDEAEEEASIYEEIYEKRPEIPKRIPLMPLVKKKKDMFYKVHQELFGKIYKHMHHHILASATKPPPRPPKTQMVRRVTSKLQSNQYNRSASKTEHTETTKASDTVTEKTTGKVDTTGAYDSGEESDLTYDYPDVSDLGQRPLPAIPNTTPELSVLRRSVSQEQPTKPPYSAVMMKDATALFKDNQTEKDFYNYSVMEAAHCFRHCGLGKFADMCFEHKLDGAFFKNFQFDDLKDEPFCLSKFDLLKVKKIIVSGWRPNDK